MPLSPSDTVIYSAAKLMSAVLHNHSVGVMPRTVKLAPGHWHTTVLEPCRKDGKCICTRSYPRYNEYSNKLRSSLTRSYCRYPSQSQGRLSVYSRQKLTSPLVSPDLIHFDIISLIYSKQTVCVNIGTYFGWAPRWSGVSQLGCPIESAMVLIARPIRLVPIHHSGVSVLSSEPQSQDDHPYKRSNHLHCVRIVIFPNFNRGISCPRESHSSLGLPRGWVKPLRYA